MIPEEHVLILVLNQVIPSWVEPYFIFKNLLEIGCEQPPQNDWVNGFSTTLARHDRPNVRRTIRTIPNWIISYFTVYYKGNVLTDYICPEVVCLNRPVQNMERRTFNPTLPGQGKKWPR